MEHLTEPADHKYERIGATREMTPNEIFAAFRRTAASSANQFFELFKSIIHCRNFFPPRKMRSALELRAVLIFLRYEETRVPAKQHFE